MKITCVIVFTAIFAATTLHAQVPQLINYQGRVTVGGTNFTGAGQFKFALVNGTGNVTYWSNDGSSLAGGQPTAAVPVPVTKGSYSVLLGDTTIANMVAGISPAVFTNADVRLRVWFNDGITGPQLLSPDQRIAAVGYAMVAGNVPRGIITNNQLGVSLNGGVVATTEQLAGFDFYNVVTDGGAAGNGLADDTAAIQFSIYAVTNSGKVVYFPTGTYLISSSLHIPPSVRLRGAAMPSTAGARPQSTIRTTADIDALYVDDQGSYQVIEGLNIHGPGQLVSTKSAINSDAVNAGGNRTIRNCLIRGFNIGVLFNGGYGSVVEMTRIGDQPGDACNTGVKFTGAVFDTVVRSCWIGYNKLGVHFAPGGANNSLMSCDMGATGQLTQVLNEQNNTLISGCNMEHLGYDAIVSTNAGVASGLTILNTQIKDFGSSKTNYSVAVANNATTIIGCNLNVNNTNTAGAIRDITPYDSSLRDSVADWVDVYNNGNLVLTYKAGWIPTEAYDSGAAASRNNWGLLQRRIYTGPGVADALFLTVRNADGSFKYADLLDWYKNSTRYVTNGQTPVTLYSTNLNPAGAELVSKDYVESAVGTLKRQNAELEKRIGELEATLQRLQQPAK